MGFGDMFGGFSGTKLKPQLKMAVSRFQIASNKKSALMKQNMREVAVLLAEEPPKEEKARIRAEALIRDDNMIEAYEILMLNCELLAERIKLIEHSKECPPDLQSCIATLLYSTPRVDIKELSLIRKQFKAKYGKKFDEAALANVGGVVNERIVSKLSVHPPAAYLVHTYLEKICEQFEVDWKPTIKLSGEQLIEPMAAPVGFSVSVAQGTGLGPEAVTGQPNIDEEISYTKSEPGGDYGLPPPAPGQGQPNYGIPPPAPGQQPNYGGPPASTQRSYGLPPSVAPSSVAPSVAASSQGYGPVVNATPYIPSAESQDDSKPATATVTSIQDNYKEDDVYMSPPLSPPASAAQGSVDNGTTNQEDKKDDDDDKDDNNDDDDQKPPAVVGVNPVSPDASHLTTYSDLAARFESLGK